MADLSSLMQIAPFAGAYQTIQSSNLEDLLRKAQAQREAALAAQTSQDTGFAAQMQPYKLNEADLNNQYLGQVKLPEGLQDLTKKRLDNQKTQDTYTSDVNATNAGNAKKVVDDGASIANTYRTSILNAGQEANQAPPPLRLQAFQAALSKQGIPPDHPMVQSLMQDMAQAGPDQFQKILNKHADDFGRIAALQSTQYRTQTEDAATRAAAEVKAAGIHAGGTVEAAKITSAGRVQAATIRSQQNADQMANVLSGKTSPDKAAVAMAARAIKLKGEGDDEGAKEAAYMAKMFDQMKLNYNTAATGGKTTITPSGGLGTTPTPQSNIDTVLAPILGESTAKAKPAPKVGTTSSGAKYTILPTN